MIGSFLTKEITYDGTQLRSHWISDQLGQFGDAILSFAGPADVKITEMVDLEDVKNRDPIFSHSMLHFIIEHFDQDFEKMILKQRLFISIMHQELLKLKPKAKIYRKNDDLFDGNAKLTVSIATVSPISTLIHTAINIENKDTPVKTKGLENYKINPKSFAKSIIGSYIDEINSIAVARTKVRGVA